MLTLEKLELYEDRLIDRLKSFTRNHPFITVKLVMWMGFIYILFTFVIMYWAAVGIGTADAHYQAEVAIGNTTQAQYESVKWVFDLSIWIFDIVMVIIDITFIAFVVFTFYLFAKICLKPKEKYE